MLLPYGISSLLIVIFFLQVTDKFQYEFLKFNLSNGYSNSTHAILNLIILHIFLANIPRRKLALVFSRTKRFSRQEV